MVMPMSPTPKTTQTEVERNFEAISAQMDDLMPLHANKYALMRNGDIVEFYNCWEDAYKTGQHFFGDGSFSVQQVTKTPVDLGYYSHAINIA